MNSTGQDILERDGIHTKIILALIFITFCWNTPLLSQETPVELLNESFTTSGPKSREKIYKKVIALVDLEETAAGGINDSRNLLARATAYIQLAMDGEDEYLTRFSQLVPAVSRADKTGASFTGSYTSARKDFRVLLDRYLFVEPYLDYSQAVSQNWSDGLALYTAALDFNARFRHSRFGERLLLLAGVRLLIEGKHTNSIEAFRALWKDYPQSSQAGKAYRIAETMSKSINTYSLNADNFLDWGYSEGHSGNAVLKKLTQKFSGTPQAEKAYLRMMSNISYLFAGRSLSSNRTQADKADEYLEKFLAEFPNSEHLGEALELVAAHHYSCGRKSLAISRKNEYRHESTRRSRYARTSARYDKYSDGHFEIVDRLAVLATRKIPDSPAYFKVGYLDALTFFERDDFIGADSVLSELIKDGPDDGSLAAILTSWGLIRYLDGSYESAADRLSMLEKMDRRDSEYWARGMLFLGKARLATGDTGGASRALWTLSKTYPYTYEGIRARSIGVEHNLRVTLVDMAETVIEPAPEFPQQYSIEGQYFQSFASEWSRLGFYAEAAYIYSNALAEASDDLNLRFSYHRMLYDAGYDYRVLRGFRRPFAEFLARGGRNLPEDFWEVAYIYPEEYREYVDMAGKKFNIPPALITAVMRQESNFHPSAKSHAGAVGLMQLLPSVGRRLARSAGLGNVSSSMIYSPKINIIAGTSYLSQSLKKYDGNIALALSTYNADPRNLPVWLDRMRGDSDDDFFDLDLFVEFIHLEETQDYNRKVLSNYWRYQEIYGENKLDFAWRLDLGS